MLPRFRQRTHDGGGEQRSGAKLTTTVGPEPLLGLGGWFRGGSSHHRWRAALERHGSFAGGTPYISRDIMHPADGGPQNLPKSASQ